MFNEATENVIFALEKLAENYRQLIKDFPPLENVEDKIKLQMSLIQTLSTLEPTMQNLVSNAGSLSDVQIVKIVRLSNDIFKLTSEVFTLYFENGLSDDKDEFKTGFDIEDLLARVNKDSN